MRRCKVMDFPHQKMKRRFILNLACFTRLITFYIFSLLFFHLEIRANVYSKDKGRENEQPRGHATS